MTHNPCPISPDALRLAQKYDLYPDFPEVCLRLWPDADVVDLICAIAARAGEQVALAAIYAMCDVVSPGERTKALAESEYAI